MTRRRKDLSSYAVCANPFPTNYATLSCSSTEGIPSYPFSPLRINKREIQANSNRRENISNITLLMEAKLYNHRDYSNFTRSNYIRFQL